MNQIVKTSLTRRQFVVASATAAGGLAIGVAWPALADAATIGPQAWGPGSVPNEVNAFLAIDPDGSILIRFAAPGDGAGRHHRAADDRRRRTRMRLVEGEGRIRLGLAQSAR